MGGGLEVQCVHTTTRTRALEIKHKLGTGFSRGRSILKKRKILDFVRKGERVDRCLRPRGTEGVPDARPK